MRRGSWELQINRRIFTENHCQYLMPSTAELGEIELMVNIERAKSEAKNNKQCCGGWVKGKRLRSQRSRASMRGRQSQ